MQTQGCGMSLMSATATVLMTLSMAATGFAVEIIDDPAHIDERAAQLVQASNSLCWEMHRYHQQQPDYRESYRSMKDIWARAGQLRDALRAGPVETEVLAQQMTELNDIFAQVEATLSKWGPGDRSIESSSSEPVRRTVVAPGIEIDIPFIGVLDVGRPQVFVVEDRPQQIRRRRPHPNSHGSQRSLERELDSVKVALSYLLEDTDVNLGRDAQATGVSSSASDGAPPPEPDTTLNEPRKTGRRLPKARADAPVGK